MISTNNPFKNNDTYYKMTEGNSKLGKMLVSSNVPSDRIFRTNKGDILGSCPTTCKGCYGLAGNYRFNGTKEYLARQTWGWRKEIDEVMHDYEAQLRSVADLGGGVVRIHANGDFVSYDELVFWLNMAKKYPNIQFYTYTKQYNFFRLAVKDGHETHLPNFVLNISVWGDFGKNEAHEFDGLYNCNIFEVVPKGTEREQGKVFCPGYDPKTAKRIAEHTCDSCGLCFRAGGKHILCVEHR